MSIRSVNIYSINLLVANGELQPILQGMDLDIVHVLNNVMRPAVLDLAALVTCADSDDGCAGRDASADTGGRVLEDDALLGVITQALRSQQERIREGLAVLEALVISGDRYGRWCDADTGHAAMRCEEA